MAKVSLNTIKSWFKKGLKPTQEQFFSTWDSFWHKDDTIPAESIENFDVYLSEKADKQALENHINDDVDADTVDGLHANDFVRRYNFNANIVVNSYTNVAKVSINRLSSRVKVIVSGTNSGVVLNSEFNITLNHYSDIIVSSKTGMYSGLFLKIDSSPYGNFNISLKKFGTETSITNCNITIISEHGNIVTPYTNNPALDYTDNSLIHETKLGATNITAYDGGITNIAKIYVENKEVYHEGNFEIEVQDENGLDIGEIKDTLKLGENLEWDNIGKKLEVSGFVDKTSNETVGGVKTYTDNQIIQGTVVAKSFANSPTKTVYILANSGDNWFRIGEWNADNRGGGEITISYNGGNNNPVSYKIQYFKNYTSQVGLVLNVLGGSTKITKCRITQETGKYYLEIYNINQPTTQRLVLYHNKILGHNSNFDLYSAFLINASGGVVDIELDFITNGENRLGGYFTRNQRLNHEIEVQDSDGINVGSIKDVLKLKKTEEWNDINKQIVEKDTGYINFTLPTSWTANSAKYRVIGDTMFVSLKQLKVLNSVNTGLNIPVEYLPKTETHLIGYANSNKGNIVILLIASNGTVRIEQGNIYPNENLTIIGEYKIRN